MRAECNAQYIIIGTRTKIDSWTYDKEYIDSSVGPNRDLKTLIGKCTKMEPKETILFISAVRYLRYSKGIMQVGIECFVENHRELFEKDGTKVEPLIITTVKSVSDNPSTTKDTEEILKRCNFELFHIDGVPMNQLAVYCNKKGEQLILDLIDSGVISR